MRDGQRSKRIKVSKRKRKRFEPSVVAKILRRKKGRSRRGMALSWRFCRARVALPTVSPWRARRGGLLLFLELLRLVAELVGLLDQLPAAWPDPSRGALPTAGAGSCR